MTDTLKKIDIMGDSPDRGDAERLVRELTVLVRRRNAKVVLKRKRKRKSKDVIWPPIPITPVPQKEEQA